MRCSFIANHAPEFGHVSKLWARIPDADIAYAGMRCRTEEEPVLSTYPRLRCAVFFAAAFGAAVLVAFLAPALPPLFSAATLAFRASNRLTTLEGRSTSVGAVIFLPFILASTMSFSAA